jgi:3'-phosphoadenosine 5'-phosphosulfate sulfotransferase (PAPS reductase)/FAD synthetase
VWLEYQPENKDFETASREGEPFAALIKKRKYLPNSIARFCTTELKVLAIDRYMKSIGIDEYCTMVGIRADEPRRVVRNNKDEKLGHSEDSDVTFGINMPLIWVWSRLAVTACFLKGGKILQGLIREKPERALWWARMEKDIGGTFRTTDAV